MAGQVWVTDSLGGYLANKRLSKQIRYAAQPMAKFRQFCQVKEAFGKHKHDTVVFDKISNLSTAGGTLVETNTMPESNFVIRRGTLVVTEYGNSVPYTGKLEALAEFSVDNATTRVLRDDEAKVIDAAVAAQFTAAEIKYVCSGTAAYALTTDGTATATAGSSGGHGNLNDYHVKNLVDQLTKYLIPKYDGENYVCIASVNALRGIKDDSNWINAQRYGDPSKLFTGEVGKYYGCRFIEENNILSNILGGSYGEAVIFGADAVMEGVALPEEVRAKIATDYGRSKGIAWYALLGFKKIWDYSTDSEGHIIHVTSA